MKTPKAAFMKSISAFADSQAKKIGAKREIICDGLAMAVAMNEGLVCKQQQAYACVELAGTKTRG